MSCNLYLGAAAEAAIPWDYRTAARIPYTLELLRSQTLEMLRMS
jgi:hypothetical protein